MHKFVDGRLTRAGWNGDWRWTTNPRRDNIGGMGDLAVGADDELASRYDSVSVPFDWAAMQRQLATAELRLGATDLSPTLDADQIRFSFLKTGVTGDAPAVIDMSISSRLHQSEFFAEFCARIDHATGVLAPFLAEYARRSALTLIFNIDDAGGPGALCFDRPAGSRWPLFPDLYLLEAEATFRKQHELREQPEQDFAATFGKRRPVLYWRGSTTSSGWIRSIDDLHSNYRVASCLKLRALPRDKVDCRISRIVQLKGLDPADAMAMLTEADILTAPVPESTFAEYQMYLDLPGNAGAWGTCYKYLAGCLVLKPPSGRELSYSHLLRPWKHYIPVARDLSDVADRLAWVANHPRQAATIAARGRATLLAVLRDVPDYVSKTLDANNALRSKRWDNMAAAIWRAGKMLVQARQTFPV